MAGRIKDMDRWLGDGGMAVIGQVGASFTAYGVDGEDLGWVEATWTPTDARRAIPTASSRPGSTRSSSTPP